MEDKDKDVSGTMNDDVTSCETRKEKRRKRTEMSEGEEACDDEEKNNVQNDESEDEFDETKRDDKISNLIENNSEQGLTRFNNEKEQREIIKKNTTMQFIP